MSESTGSLVPAAHEETGRPTTEPALRVEHLTKAFGASLALDDASLEVRRGEIHALVGQNGSGKSTLIKILAGFHHAGPGGYAHVSGEPIDLEGTGGEGRARARFVHQDLALVPTLTVRENLWLGARGTPGLVRLRHGDERRKARELLSVFDLDIDPDTPTGELPPGQQSALAIVRAMSGLDRGVDLLVLDEPTASLGREEATALHQMMRRVRDRGVGVLFVSHFLPEVLSVAERVTVFRDGCNVATCEVATTSQRGLVELMLGHAASEVSPPAFASKSAPVLAVRGLTSELVQDVSFSVEAGEVLGITGLLGSGHHAIAEHLAGARPWHDGEVVMGDDVYNGFTPHEAIAAGLVTVPSDRRGQGVILSLSVRENITLPMIGQAWQRGMIRPRLERADVLRWIADVGIEPPDPDAPVGTLSGGNQQKVMIARALRLQPRVLVVAEPTQAVDVGASASIHVLLTELAAAGQVIVVVSSDTEELELICTRVLVARGGKLVASLVGDEITEERILLESQFEVTA